MVSGCNRNPDGKNQHGPVEKADNPRLRAALETYHKEKLTSNTTIALRLKLEHGIERSASTVKRRRKELGLHASVVTSKTMPSDVAEQLVLKQMERDPAMRQGVRTMQAKVAYESGVHLPRYVVSDTMHMHCPEGFDKRKPTAKKIAREPIHPIGIHERWSADGHDKLLKIGFGAWAVVDRSTSRLLGGWILPRNRMGKAVAYCFLELVEEYSGIPLQLLTDCGSENTVIYGVINALREQFHPELDMQELVPHVFVRSVHNTPIERSWLRLRMDWGDDVIVFFRKGINNGIYNPDDPNQYDLCQWVWARALRKDMNEFIKFRNSVTMRKNHEKPGPSGTSRNNVFTIHARWGGRNCLKPVDVDVVQEMKNALGEGAGVEGLLEFTSPEYSKRAEEVFLSLGVLDLRMHNAWDVFMAMYPLMYPKSV
ncbi:hypothetical protein OF83DRAFT_1166884 [Amylostereum chailletii]|nr:hypothetical protein OF83DRAFT_1166884 [Amylostereum chailletii]